MHIAQGFLGYGLCSVVSCLGFPAVHCDAEQDGRLRCSAMPLFLYNNIYDQMYGADTYAVLHLMEKGRRFLTRKSEVVKRSCDPIFRSSENLSTKTRFLCFIFRSFRINVERNGKWIWEESVWRLFKKCEVFSRIYFATSSVDTFLTIEI
jgi:hypothetical protein